MTGESISSVDLLVMLGEAGASFPEQIVDSVREAIAWDTVEKGLAAKPAIGRVIVSTRNSSLSRSLNGLPVHIVPDPAGEAFHFGRRLHAIAREWDLRTVLYIGGGASPLLSIAQLIELAEILTAAPNRLVTNNLYSSDLVGFDARLLEQIELPDKDNDLAWRLAQLGKLDVRQPPRTASTAFDVDTVTDVLVLSMCPQVGRHTSDALAKWPLDTSRLEAVLARLRDPHSRLLLIGRVSSSIWQTLQERVPCTTRVIAEERGMRASGRLARGEVRSLVGFAAEKYGFEGLFARLAQEADAILMDSRVLFAHFGRWPSDADRYYSDLGMPAQIEDPLIRRLTEAVVNAPIPIVLGGHSLLSGGILALLEAIGL